MLPSLVMNSLSTLILQLRNIARSPAQAHIHEHRIESSKRKNGRVKSKAVIRQLDATEKMATHKDGEKFYECIAPDVYIPTDPTSGQLAGRCPRCYLDLRFKDTQTANATTQGTGKCQLYRYRRATRRPRKVRAPANGSNPKFRNNPISKESIERLSSILSTMGQQQGISGPALTPASISKLLASLLQTFSTAQQQLTLPRIGMFIDAVPSLKDITSSPEESFNNYANILLTLVQRLSTISSPQIDRETQAKSPIIDSEFSMKDSSVQCDQEVGVIELPLNLTMLEHLDWTPVTVRSKSKEMMRNSDSKRSLPPIAKRVVFTPGEDLILKLSGTSCPEKDETIVEEKLATDCVCCCTVAEIPSNLVIQQRCKDVTSLPIQGSSPMASHLAQRLHRSCTQSEYLTKTAWSLLNESKSSANVYALLNSDSFTSEKSKRNLGNFLLKERMKRILSNILSEHQCSKIKFKSEIQKVNLNGTEKAGNPSSASDFFQRKLESAKKKVALKWDLKPIEAKALAVTKSTNVSSSESTGCSNCKFNYMPKSILIESSQKYCPANLTEYTDMSCQCESGTNMDDIEQEELRLLRQILLRSCSFTETESACHLSLALDRKTILQAVMAAFHGSNKEDFKDLREFLPRDSCSFAEYLSSNDDNIDKKTRSYDLNNDLMVTIKEKEKGNLLTVKKHVDQGIGSRFVEKSIQTDYVGDYMTGKSKRSISWSPGLKKGLWLKHLNVMAAS